LCAGRQTRIDTAINKILRYTDTPDIDLFLCLAFEQSSRQDSLLRIIQSQGTTGACCIAQSPSKRIGDILADMGNVPNSGFSAVLANARILPIHNPKGSIQIFHPYFCIPCIAKTK
jgi:hypothetical protein